MKQPKDFKQAKELKHPKQGRNTSYVSLHQMTIPFPTPSALQTQIPFNSNIKLWYLITPSILFTSSDFWVSFTKQTQAIVPRTGRSESAVRMSFAERTSFPSQQYRRIADFIGQGILQHTSFPYCGSEKSYCVTVRPNRFPASVTTAKRKL